MPSMLSPRQTAALLGVSESSVKRWVDRGRIRAERTAGGHRRIPLPEVARFVREEGHAVVRPDLLGLGGEGATPEQGRPPTVAGEPETGGDLQGRFFGALLEGRPERARRLLVEAFLAGQSVARLIDDVLAPALRQAGDLWQCRSDGIFIEHRAVGIC
ncbi:MAG: helix-turn-helix domain-containing protein, partial [Thiohalorhabdaceae bacterium]